MEIVIKLSKVHKSYPCSRLNLFPWTPKPWKMKVFSPKNTGCNPCCYYRCWFQILVQTTFPARGSRNHARFRQISGNKCETSPKLPIYFMQFLGLWKWSNLTSIFFKLDWSNHQLEQQVRPWQYAADPKGKDRIPSHPFSGANCKVAGYPGSPTSHHFCWLVYKTPFLLIINKDYPRIKRSLFIDRGLLIWA